MLPITDYNPRDESCIYSVLFCIIQRAKRLKHWDSFDQLLCELKHLNSKN